jgi:hypothetical protein
VLLGLKPQQHWPSLGGVPSLGHPRPGHPVEGNGRHTQLMGLSHRVVGRAVNCPLGLRSSLGGEAASTWETSLAVLCVHNMAELVSSSRFVHCTVCTLYKLTGLFAWLKPRHIQYTCMCLGKDRISIPTSNKIMFSKQCSGSFQNIPNLFVYQTSLI